MRKIAIASGKGGTGKTTLATNLAKFLSEREDHIVLVDMDVEEPNSLLFFHGKEEERLPQYRTVPQWDAEKCKECGECSTICQFNAIAQFPGAVEIFPELCHSCYACVQLCPHGALKPTQRETGILTRLREENLTLVESRLTVGETSAVPLLKATHHYLDNTFNTNDWIVIDAPPGTACAMVETVKNADYVILVTEPTPLGVHDLRLAVETLRQLRRPFGVVINKYGVGTREVDHYCQESNIPILGKIPFSQKMAQTYSHGDLLFSAFPEVAKELEAIYGEIKQGNNQAIVNSQ